MISTVLLFTTDNWKKTFTDFLGTNFLCMSTGKPENRTHIHGTVHRAV